MYSSFSPYALDGDDDDPQITYRSPIKLLTRFGKTIQHQRSRSRSWSKQTEPEVAQRIHISDDDTKGSFDETLPHNYKMADTDSTQSPDTGNSESQASHINGASKNTANTGSNKLSHSEDGPSTPSDHSENPELFDEDTTKRELLPPDFNVTTDELLSSKLSLGKEVRFKDKNFLSQSQYRAQQVPSHIGNMASGGQSQNDPNVYVIADSLSDLIPESYSGNNPSTDVEDFFGKFKTWVIFHPSRFNTEQAKVNAIRYVLSKDALDWWTNLISDPTRVPNSMQELENVFYAKYRRHKTRTSWKKELELLKYQPGQSPLQAMNRFQYIASKIGWDNDLTLKKYIASLPVSLRSFIAPANPTTFQQVLDLIDRYQELIETDLTPHVSFQTLAISDEVTCKLCDKSSHATIECPSLRSLVDTEIQQIENERQSRPRNTGDNDSSRSASTDSEYYSSGRRYRSPSGSPYRYSGDRVQSQQN